MAKVAQNIYVFNVLLTANKQQIAAAVAEQYGVTIKNVDYGCPKPVKAVRFSRGKNRYPGTTNRKDTRKPT
jgi:ribosomal protein L23